MNDEPLIVHSAIKYPDGDIITGHRHHNCIEVKARMGYKTTSDCIQGFVDHRGKFYTREEARQLTLRNGQLNKDHEGTLYSEDLWKESILNEG